MSDRFKITWNGSTRVLDKTPENFAKLEKMKAAGEDFSVEPYVETPSKDAGTYVDEMNVLGSNDAPLPVTASKAQKAAPVDNRDFLRDALSDVKNNAADFGRGVRHGASFGFADELAGLASKLTGGDYDKTKREWQTADEFSKRRSPWLYTGGDMTGALAPALATGGTASLTGLAARLGARAVPAAIAGGMAEGALRGAGDAAAGNTLRDAGIGAVVGGVIPAAGAGLQSAGQALAKRGLALRGQVLSPTLKNTKELQERYGSDVADEELGRMLERFVPPNAIKPRDAGQYRDALSAGLKQTGQTLDSVVATAAKNGADAAVPQAQERLVQSAMQHADDYDNRAGMFNKNVTAKLRDYLDQLTTRGPDKFTPVRVDANKEGAQSLRGFWKQRQAFDQDTRYTPTGAAPDTAQSEAAKLVGDANRTELKTLVKQFAPAQAPVFEQANENYGQQAMLKDIAARAAANEANTTPVGALIRNTAIGAAIGGGVQAARGRDWQDGALLGAGLLGGTGTMSQAAKALSSPTGRDLLANVARTYAPMLANGGKTLVSPTTSRAVSVATNNAVHNEPYTSAGRAMQMLRQNPAALGERYAQHLSQLADDEDKFAREVERLEQTDPDFRQLVSGSK